MGIQQIFLTGPTGIGKSLLLKRMVEAAGPGGSTLIDPLNADPDATLPYRPSSELLSMVIIDHAIHLNDPEGLIHFCRWYCAKFRQPLILVDISLSGVKPMMEAHRGTYTHVHLTRPFSDGVITANVDGEHRTMTVEALLSIVGMEGQPSPCFSDA